MSDEVVSRVRGPLPVQLPTGVVESPEFAQLPAVPLRVYLQLWKYSRCARIFPSRETIGRQARVLRGDGTPDTGQVRRAVRHLEAVGLIRTTKRGGESGKRQTSNLYELLDPPTFVRYDDEGDPVFDLDKLVRPGEGVGSAPLPGAGTLPPPPRDRGFSGEPPEGSDPNKRGRGEDRAVADTDRERRSTRGRYTGPTSGSDGGIELWK